MEWKKLVGPAVIFILGVAGGFAGYNFQGDACKACEAQKAASASGQ